MITINSKTNSLGAGNLVYLGRPRPGGGGSTSWLPTAGTMAPAGLNTMASVFDTANPNPLVRGSSSILNAWCSTLFAKDYGTYGSIIAFGGGHQDYMGNDVYRYDLATQLWSRIINPTTPGITILNYDDIAGNQWGEYWTDSSKTAVIVGKPCPPHTYGNFKYVPAALAGNTNGWVVVMGGFCFQAHYIDLDDLATGWKRLGGLWTDVVANSASSSYGSSLIDTFRKRIACFPANPNGQPYGIAIDFGTKAVSSFSQNYVSSYYTLSDYDAQDDLYLTTGFQPPTAGGAWPITVTDPKTGIKYTPPTTGTAPPGINTAEWVESKRAWYMWFPNSPNLYKLSAPADPRTQAWVWSTVSFTNSTAIIDQTGATYMYNRLHYVPSLDAFTVAVAVDKQVQFWKL